MSAFIVSPETINKAVFAMLPRDSSAEQCDHFGARLYAMNVQALRERYPRLSIETPEFSYRVTFKYSPCELLKACHCLRYQCHEGKVPEMLLYQHLDDTCHSLAASIVCELPEYKAAPWE